MTKFAAKQKTKNDKSYGEVKKLEGEEHYEKSNKGAAKAIPCN